jgi:NADH-quinone oxidoreductase subunit L
MHHAKDAIHDHETNDHDIFNMGGLIHRMPLTGWTYLIATLAITGLPLTAGFMSKDEILTGAMAYGDLQSGIAKAIPWVGFGVTMLTAVYMWRQVFLVFFGRPAKIALYEKIKETPKLMTVPLVILAVFTLWFWFGKNPMNPDGGRFLKHWIATPAQIIPPQTAPRFLPRNFTPTLDSTVISPMPHQIALEEHRAAVSGFAELTALTSAAFGFVIGCYFFLFRRRSGAVDRTPSSFFLPLSSFLQKGWYIDTIYEYVVVDTVTFTSRMIAWGDRMVVDGAVNLAAHSTVVIARIAGAFDKYVVDGLVTLVGASVQFFGLMARSVQTGRIQTYLTWVVAAVVVVLLILRFSLIHF